MEFFVMQGGNNVHNYVIFGEDSELYLTIYSDVTKLHNCRYIKSEIDSSNWILVAIYRLVERIRYLIGKKPMKIWNKIRFVKHFTSAMPIIFIFFRSRLHYLQTDYDLYLRKRYPDCKLVAFYQDIVSRFPETNPMLYKSRLDLMLTFDHRDASQFNLTYYPLVYSPYKKNLKKTAPPSDVLS